MNPLRGWLDSELDQICDEIVRMGDMVKQATLRAMEALADQDVELAQQVVDQDEAVNQLRYEIEAQCFALLATQHPVARDLRLVVTALNIITDLERIGDYAKGIGRIVVRTGGQELLMPTEKSMHMAQVGCDMLETVIDAFVEHDTEVAQRIFDMDDEVDHTYRSVFESVIQAMIGHEHGVRQGMYLLFAAHNLERIGDRVTNIAERVLFMQTGVLAEYNL